jgi:hypothetical protein
MSNPDPTQTIRLTPEHLSQWMTESSHCDVSRKRSESRQNLYPELVNIQILRKGSPPILIETRSRDLCENGMGLTSRYRIDDGELLDVRFSHDGRTYEAHARVVHCTQTVGGYKVGLTFIFD